MSIKISIADIVKNAKFKCANGIVWIIDNIETWKEFTLVSTSMENGSKGNYRDDINTVVDFLNEEGAKKI